MRTRYVWIALFALALTGQAARAAEPAPQEVPVAPPAVVSDVGPAPAEERDSSGAIVLITSPVPAQREDFERLQQQRLERERELRAATQSRLEEEARRQRGLDEEP